MVTRSPKRASSLVTVDRQHTSSNKIDDKTYGARSENKLLEKSSPESAATQPANNIAKRNLVAAILLDEDGERYGQIRSRRFAREVYFPRSIGHSMHLETNKYCVTLPRYVRPQLGLELRCGWRDEDPL